MFQPSPRQEKAIASMEAQLGIRQRQREFADGAAFDTYYQRLQGRCQKKRSEDPAARRQRRQQRLAAYYQDYERLRAYALAYNLRYQPSSPALLAALRRKCPDTELCQGVLDSLAEQLNDLARAWELACSLHERGLNRQDIRQRLLRRRFASASIAQVLSRLEEAIGETPLAQDAVQGKVAQLQRRGMSSSAIVGRLASSAQEREQVRSLIGDASSEDQRAAEELWRKWRRQGLDPRRIQQRLARRGFSSAAIRAALAASEKTSD